MRRSLLLALGVAGLLGEPAVLSGAPQGGPAAVAAAPSLDYGFFKARVQPIFLTRRPRHARCYSCHALGAGEGDAPAAMRLQILSPGTTTWTEEQSRMNFEAVRQKAVAGNLMASPLLRHALRFEAGGDLEHGGGAQFTSANDPDWQTIAAWVKGAKAGAATAAEPASTERR